MNYDEARVMAIETAKRYIGTPYVWGGDDPSGFDCSGLVIECLKSAGIVGDDFDSTANGLLATFKGKSCPFPRAGAMAFFLRQDGTARHVVLCISARYYIGADKGNSTTNTQEDAWSQNAYVRIRPIPEKAQWIVFADPFQQ